MNINSRILMIASSITPAVLGIATSFFPKEILIKIGLAPTELPILFIQITGALFFGFSIMNWMAKNVSMGGIYSRPLSIGNFLHFMMGALALAKAAMNNTGSKYIWIAAIVYGIFAVLFGNIMFTNPLGKDK